MKYWLILNTYFNLLDKNPSFPSDPCKAVILQILAQRPHVSRHGTTRRETQTEMLIH